MSPPRGPVLVTGPVRSGKSRHAERLVADVIAAGETATVATYVATGRRADPDDPAWSRRIAEHVRRRPDGWLTIETADVAGALRTATGPVLVDCLGTWLTAVVDTAGWDDLDAAREVVRAATAELIEAVTATTAPLVLVSNEVGWSLVPTTESGRFFQDELGRLNAAVSRVVAHVHLVVAGRVLDLSDAPLVDPGPPGA
ncbi:MAG: bifunctional adenosylcobinamide kinase/adenosylcobinamide-phosphate guanylyltransferase [Terracoccus sp.]